MKINLNVFETKSNTVIFDKLMVNLGHCSDRGSNSGIFWTIGQIMRVCKLTFFAL